MNALKGNTNVTRMPSASTRLDRTHVNAKQGTLVMAPSVGMWTNVRLRKQMVVSIPTARTPTVAMSVSVTVDSSMTVCSLLSFKVRKRCCLKII